MRSGGSLHGGAVRQRGGGSQRHVGEATPVDSFVYKGFKGISLYNGLAHPLLFKPKALKLEFWVFYRVWCMAVKSLRGVLRIL